LSGATNLLSNHLTKRTAASVSTTPRNCSRSRVNWSATPKMARNDEWKAFNVDSNIMLIEPNA